MAYVSALPSSHLENRLPVRPDRWQRLLAGLTCAASFAFVLVIVLVA